MLGSIISTVGNLLGGLLGRQSQSEANAQNIALQKQFAQQGIRWRVEDAKAAGIHPLYALGANTHSFAPTVVGDTSLPNALAQSGQDIARAVDAKRTAGEKFNVMYEALQLKRMELENTLLASQIAKINQAGHPPGMPGGDLTATRIFGSDIRPNPAFSDAQDIQNRYGEPAEWVYFPMVAGGDVYHKLKEWGAALTRASNDPRYKRIMGIK